MYDVCRGRGKILLFCSCPSRPLGGGAPRQNDTPPFQDWDGGRGRPSFQEFPLVPACASMSQAVASQDAADASKQRKRLALRLHQEPGLQQKIRKMQKALKSIVYA
ncbi:MAG TPA: hypothetical protein DCZ95_09775 [Verrucomicrobia bacterium]|nr:hypothetical protein [Verrucomicrobiota bacterium]